MIINGVYLDKSYVAPGELADCYVRAGYQSAMLIYMCQFIDVIIPSFLQHANDFAFFENFCAFVQLNGEALNLSHEKAQTVIDALISVEQHVKRVLSGSLLRKATLKTIMFSTLRLNKNTQQLAGYFLFDQSLDKSTAKII
ncbi:MAG: hypothetical protein LLG04_07615 [Parachlamydia sp.]|nr:hypothetical protein [Parachlamydia sp.]